MPIRQLRREGGPRGRGHPRPRGEGGARRRQVICAANDAGYGGRVRSAAKRNGAPRGSPSRRSHCYFKPEIRSPSTTLRPSRHSKRYQADNQSPTYPTISTH